MKKLIGRIGRLTNQRRQPLREAPHTLAQLVLANGVGKAHVRIGAMTAEVEPRRERDAGGLERLDAKALTIHSKSRAIRIDEKSSFGHDWNSETKFAQRGHEEIPTGTELPPARFQNRQRLR